MIGDYTSTNPIILAEDANTNPIFKIELDAKLDEDFEVDLSFLGTALFGSNYTVATQDPEVPTGTILPTNTSTCYFVYPDNPNFPAASISAGMTPCGSVVIPKGKTYVEVQVVQQPAAPRPTINSTVKIELLSSDRIDLDNESATATISPRVGRYTYSTTVNSIGTTPPICPVANLGYSYASRNLTHTLEYHYLDPAPIYVGLVKRILKLQSTAPSTPVYVQRSVHNLAYGDSQQLTGYLNYQELVGGVLVNKIANYDDFIYTGSDPVGEFNSLRAQYLSAGYIEQIYEQWKGYCNYIEN
jgi:hypothetical protein